MPKKAKIIWILTMAVLTLVVIGVGVLTFDPDFNYRWGYTVKTWQMKARAKEAKERAAIYKKQAREAYKKQAEKKDKMAKEIKFPVSKDLDKKVKQWRKAADDAKKKRSK